MDRSLLITTDDFQGHTDDLDGEEKDDFDDIVFSQDFEGDTDYTTPNKKQRIDDLPNDLTDEDLEPNAVRPGDGRSLMDHDDEADNLQSDTVGEDGTVDHYPLGAEGSSPPLESLGAHMPRLSPMAPSAKGPVTHSFVPPMPGGYLGHPNFLLPSSFVPVLQHSQDSCQPPPQASGSGVSSFSPPLPATQASFNDMKNTLMLGCLSFEGSSGVARGGNETGEARENGTTNDPYDTEAHTGHSPSDEQPNLGILAQQNDDPPSSSDNGHQSISVGPLPMRPPYGLFASQPPPDPSSVIGRGNSWVNPMVSLPQVAPNFHLSMMHQLPIAMPATAPEVMPHHSIGGLTGILPIPIPPYTAISPANQRKCSLPTTSMTNGAKVVPVSSSYDTEELTEYQILIRQQLEFFEATLADVQASVQGRRKKLSVGQVGIRCKHCAYHPARFRGRSSVYYPSFLGGVYQSAQNMAKNHLCESCDSIPDALKERLRFLQKQGGLGKNGKGYWVEGCRFVGIVETVDKKLRFKGSRIGSPTVEGENEG